MLFNLSGATDSSSSTNTTDQKIDCAIGLFPYFWPGSFSIYIQRFREIIENKFLLIKSIAKIKKIRQMANIPNITCEFFGCQHFRIAEEQCLYHLILRQSHVPLRWIPSCPFQLVSKPTWLRGP